MPLTRPVTSLFAALQRHPTARRPARAGTAARHAGPHTPPVQSWTRRRAVAINAVGSALSSLPAAVRLGCSGCAFLQLTKRSARAASQTSASSSSSSDTDTQQELQFSLLRIAGDGRCLFRSLTQGGHLAAAADAAKRPQLLPPAAETARADELRQEVCDELLKRRDELCWFIDEDYDCYVARMRQPHTWGGEPELAAAMHVLQRPIAVFMQGNPSLVLVSRYGEDEHGDRAEVPLLFHGGGHYDLLGWSQSPVGSLGLRRGPAALPDSYFRTLPACGCLQRTLANHP